MKTESAKKLLKRGFVDFKVREPKKDKFGEDKYGKDIPIVERGIF